MERSIAQIFRNRGPSKSEKQHTVLPPKVRRNGGLEVEVEPLGKEREVRGSNHHLGGGGAVAKISECARANKTFYFSQK